MLSRRMITGSLLGALALLAFLLPGRPGGVLFALLCGVLIAVAVREFGALAAAAGQPGNIRPAAVFAPVLVASVALPALFGCGGGGGGSAETVVLTAFLAWCWYLVVRQRDFAAGFRAVLPSVAAVLLVYWPLSFLVKLYYADGLTVSGRLLALFAVAVTKSGDIGAYAVGTLTAARPQGNHKLGARISPKKSWEGLVGGVAFSAVTALFLVAVSGRWLGAGKTVVLGPFSALGWGVLAAGLGLLGDLAESALKRAAQAKDSGRLPGLGGVLDLADSLLFVAPVFYAYVRVCAAVQ